MIHQLIEDRVLQRGLTYQEYVQHTIEEVANTDPAGLDEKSLEQYNNKKLNLYRSSRIEKTFKISDELHSEIKKISEYQLWMIISENWCGDSAQIVPYIYLITGLNPNIRLRIISRDTNPEIMDLYLTNGTRSIPIVAGFDKYGNELFKWGPRPQMAHDLVKSLKDQGLEKKDWLEKLHLWYGRNRGVEIERELLNTIKKLKG